MLAFDTIIVHYGGVLSPEGEMTLKLTVVRWAPSSSTGASDEQMVRARVESKGEQKGGLLVAN